MKSVIEMEVSLFMVEAMEVYSSMSINKQLQIKPKCYYLSVFVEVATMAEVTDLALLYIVNSYFSVRFIFLHNVYV